MTSDELEPLVIDAFGVPVAVLPTDAAARARWATQWSRALLADTPPAAVIDAAELEPEHDVHVLDQTLTSRVTIAALGLVGAGRISLHAAGLTDAQGRTLALVAASGTGKTTAARTLGRHFGYLSDETVSVGPDLDVLPYQKPLSMVLDPQVPTRKRQQPPDELHLLAPTLPARLERLVGLRRGASEVEGPRGLHRLALSAAVHMLVPQTSYLAAFDHPILELTRLVERLGGAWELRYVDIGDHVGDLRGLLEHQPPAEPEAWRHLPGGADAAPPPAPPPGTLVRAAWRDAVEFEDAVVVLADDRCFRLDHLPHTLWLSLDLPRTRTELEAVAVEVHGAHPEATRLVADALDVLEDAGLVVGHALSVLP